MAVPAVRANIGVGVAAKTEVTVGAVACKAGGEVLLKLPPVRRFMHRIGALMGGGVFPILKHLHVMRMHVLFGVDAGATVHRSGLGQRGLTLRSGTERKDQRYEKGGKQPDD